MSRVFERLSTGSRINHASDDAAGLSLSSKLNTNKRVYTQGIRNLNDGISALSVADQAVAQLSEIVTRQRELAEQAANGSYSNTQRTALNTEAQSLASEYTRICQSTSFNGAVLLDGSQSGVLLQGGFGANGAINAQYLTTTETAGGSTLIDAGTNTNRVCAYGGTTEVDNGALVVDLNNDGYKDVVALSIADNGITATFRIRVYIGSAAGTFTLSASANKSLDYGGGGGEAIQSHQFTANYTDVGSDGDYDIQILAGVTGNLGTNTTELETFTNNTVGTSFSMDTAFNDNNAVGGDMHLTNNTYLNYADFNADGITDDITVSAANVTVAISNTTTVNVQGSIAIQTLTQSAFSLTSQTNAQAALDTLDSNLDTLSQVRGKVGAALSRVNVGKSILQGAVETNAAAESQITSIDVAEDSAKLIRLKILQDVGTSILAHSNQTPEIALSLLAGFNRK